MKRWLCWGYDGIVVEVEAWTASEAAQSYVDDGDWNTDELGTVFVTVHVVVDGADPYDSEAYTITVEPVEPECSSDDHDWSSEGMGGCDENPGVFGHGGGAIIIERCPHCGVTRTTDTWAQNIETGEQGLTSVEYG